MSIVRADRAPRFDLNGARFTVFAGPSNGSQQICAWRLTLAAGQHRSAAPARPRRGVHGAVRAGPDHAGRRGAGAGDSAVVPAGEPIAVANPGDRPAELYVSIQAGFTRRGPGRADHPALGSTEAGVGEFEPAQLLEAGRDRGPAPALDPG